MALIILSFSSHFNMHLTCLFSSLGRFHSPPNVEHKRTGPGSKWSLQHWLREWRPDRLDAHGRTPDIPEAVRTSEPHHQPRVSDGPSRWEIPSHRGLQYPWQQRENRVPVMSYECKNKSFFIIVSPETGRWYYAFVFIWPPHLLRFLVCALQSVVIMRFALVMTMLSSRTVLFIFAFKMAAVGGDAPPWSQEDHPASLVTLIHINLCVSSHCFQSHKEISYPPVIQNIWWNILC